VFRTPLLNGVLIRRYKRFLADVQFPNGTVFAGVRTVHVANPGAMTGCAVPGSEVLVSDSGDPRRKLPLSWELVRVGRTWVCVNTAIANRTVRGWLEAGRLFADAGPLREEPRHGSSRFDFALGDDVMIEVKSVTLRVDGASGVGAFPDSVTARGRRHMEELAALRGPRRVVIFFVARGDVRVVRPAGEIDPAYGDALRRAVDAGVEVIALGARFDRHGVHWRGELPVDLGRAVH